MSNYYKNKLETIKDIFDTGEVILGSDCLFIKDKSYPIINDVIILLDESKYSDYISNYFQVNKNDLINNPSFSKDIQSSFGDEWTYYEKILEEYEQEFEQYFDLVDISALKNKRVCDLGCGNGRWSFMLQNQCRELILIDFSDAIFTARKNLVESDKCLFFMGDLKDLPFRNNFSDFLYCLGVLHHLPTSCLEEVRNIKRYAPHALFYLYYDLDNRPIYYKAIMVVITLLRKYLCKIKNIKTRIVLSKLGVYTMYYPLILVGHLFRPLCLDKYVPLYEFYQNKSTERIEQDFYDRFFTCIEQRVTRNDIKKLETSFEDVVISDNIPYWHFICKR